ncbi:MAG TPA: pyruvate dehydrogenase complex E1 component subunit beta [bacterium]|nr:pyruvate dehydrogenase complex E1 component subunit beta [Candidatus Omnitrophota bacterium]HOJ61139.1 pyruvate dehydrogenase complex E1 component subunit beta [bacterium]HPP00527.1 pyruvate dehydrogenase complex E1 component subunit beta [bacterium]HXK94312.1 pyruvate dehydrogenase complex E1 component subunit beta [bacterium]
MPLIEFREALNQAMCEEMERDETIFLMGEEVGLYNGAYKVSRGMLERFGPKRVIDSPITENSFVGLGVGAANVGLRPIIEVMTFNFAILALDQIINNAAKMRYMSGGQLKTPMVIRGPGGAARQLSCQHSQAIESFFVHTPGLIVVMPSTPYDAKGLLKSSIRDDNPVIFIESEVMYGMKGEVPEEEYLIPLGVSNKVRDGSDCTLVSYSKMIHLCQDAAKQLAGEGIECDIIDLRTLRPLDLEPVYESVAKTHRVVIVQEAWPMCGVASEVAFRITEDLFDELDAPPARVTAEDIPRPYAKNLEEACAVQPDKIIHAVKKVCYLAE